MIVLDTNVVSELMRPSPDPTVFEWAMGQAAETMFVTAISKAEVLFGVALLPAGSRRTALQEAAVKAFDLDFAGKVLPFDEIAAEHYAVTAAHRRSAGLTVTPLDLQIAAIALSRNAAVATRNVTDFQGFGPPVVNPWARYDPTRPDV